MDVTPQMVGIDLGLHDTVTLSSGEKVGNEKFFAKDEKKLAKAQRVFVKEEVPYGDVGSPLSFRQGRMSTAL